MQTPFRLDGLKALVTGGASGIGESTARVLTEAGASVTIVDVDRARAESLSAELPGSSVVILDITDEAAVNAAFAKIQALDILVNNAGVALVGGIEETALADFQRIFRVNVEGMYLVSKAAIPLLLAAKGCMVNIGSVAGLIAVKRRFAYCATKGAVVALSRQLAIDYAGRMRVNCICPGTIATPFVDAYIEKNFANEKEKAWADLHARQPIGRCGYPVEIAHMALYLCSREAEFVTGSVMTIDGGWTAA
jgi:2-keto-3-deoxy-L-fuconate dehydrogenase